MHALGIIADLTPWLGREASHALTGGIVTAGAVFAAVAAMLARPRARAICDDCGAFTVDRTRCQECEGAAFYDACSALMGGGGN